MAKFISNTIQGHIARWNSEKNNYEFLVLKRSDDVLKYPGIWQVITGIIEENETALQCVIREVQEETTLRVKDIWVLPYVTHFFNVIKDSISAAPVFGILINEDEQVKISSEHQDYQWLELEQALFKLFLSSHKQGTRVFLEEILLGDNADLYKVDLRKFDL